MKLIFFSIVKKGEADGDGIELTEEEMSLSLQGTQEDPGTTNGEGGDLIVTVDKEKLSRDHLTTYNLPKSYFQVKYAILIHWFDKWFVMDDLLLKTQNSWKLFADVWKIL